MMLPRPDPPTTGPIDDVRAFFGSGRKLNWGFAALSIAIPGFFFGMMTVSAKEKEYRPPEVVFVERIDETRSEAEIRQDTIEYTKKLRADQAELQRLEAAKRKQFQDMKDAMDNAGF
jgi:hypothetical protein